MAARTAARGRWSQVRANYSLGRARRGAGPREWRDVRNAGGGAPGAGPPGAGPPRCSITPSARARHSSSWSFSAPTGACACAEVTWAPGGPWTEASCRNCSRFAGRKTQFCDEESEEKSPLLKLHPFISPHLTPAVEIQRRQPCSVGRSHWNHRLSTKVEPVGWQHPFFPSECEREVGEEVSYSRNAAIAAGLLSAFSSDCTSGTSTAVTW